MRKYLVGLFLSFIVLLPTFAFSEVDYSNLKGDYKIFFLNDSLEEIRQKVNYLIERGEIRQANINLPFVYETSVLGEDATLYFYFYQNKVNNIGIIFRKLYVTRKGIDALSYLLDDLKDMLTLTYGKAINNQPVVFKDLYSLYSIDEPKHAYDIGGTRIEISADNPYLPYFPKSGRGGIIKDDIIIKALEWENKIGIPRQEEMRQSIIKNAYKMAEADYLNGRQKDYPITYVYQWELPLKTVSVGVLKRDYGCLAKIEIKGENISINSINDFN